MGRANGRALRCRTLIAAGAALVAASGLAACSSGPDSARQVDAFDALAERYFPGRLRVVDAKPDGDSARITFALHDDPDGYARISVTAPADDSAEGAEPHCWPGEGCEEALRYAVTRAQREGTHFRAVRDALQQRGYTLFAAAEPHQDLDYWVAADLTDDNVSAVLDDFAAAVREAQQSAAGQGSGFNGPVKLRIADASFADDPAGDSVDPDDPTLLRLAADNLERPPADEPYFIDSVFPEPRSDLPATLTLVLPDAQAARFNDAAAPLVDAWLEDNAPQMSVIDSGVYNLLYPPRTLPGTVSRVHLEVPLSDSEAPRGAAVPTLKVESAPDGSDVVVQGIRRPGQE